MQNAIQERTVAAIEKRHGWDYCDHDRVRRFCPECKYEVPAFMRRGDPKHYRVGVPIGESQQQKSMTNCIMFSGSEEQLEEGNRNYWTIEAMAKFGGSFVQALAECARRADMQNLAKIKTTWSEYWNEYEGKGREIEQNN